MISPKRRANHSTALRGALTRAGPTKSWAPCSTEKLATGVCGFELSVTLPKTSSVARTPRWNFAPGVLPRTPMTAKTNFAGEDADWVGFAALPLPLAVVAGQVRRGLAGPFDRPVQVLRGS